MRRKRGSILEDIGETVLSVAHDADAMLRMLGATVREFGRVIVRPATFRGMAVARQIELAGRPGRADHRC